MQIAVENLCLAELRAHARTLGGPDSYDPEVLRRFITDHYNRASRG